MDGPSRPSTVSPPQYHQGLEARIETNILPSLARYFSKRLNGRVLEIASGQGVHCKVLSKHFPSVTFQPTECDEYMCSQVGKTNQGNEKVQKAIVLDVTEEHGGWDELEKQAEADGKFDLVFVSNALHMIPYPEGPHSMFKHFNSLVAEDGLFLAYGPFKNDQGFTSDADEKFDAMIRARPDGSGLGLRSVDDLDRIARSHGWRGLAMHEVALGNLVLVFGRLSAEDEQGAQVNLETESSADSSTLEYSSTTDSASA